MSNRELTEQKRALSGEIYEYRGREVHVSSHMAEGNIDRWTDHADRFLEECPTEYDVERFTAHTGRHYVGARISYPLGGLNVGVTLSKFDGFRPIRTRSVQEVGTVFVLFDPHGEPDA